MLQPLLQERKRFSERAHSGVFSARRTAVREQTPPQGKSSPRREGSGLSKSVFHHKTFKSAVSHPGNTHGVDVGATWCQAPAKGGPSSEGCARKGCQ